MASCCRLLLRGAPGSPACCVFGHDNLRTGQHEATPQEVMRKGASKVTPLWGSTKASPTNGLAAAGLRNLMLPLGCRFLVVSS